MSETTMSTVYPMQSDKISGHTSGGYPIGDRAISSKDLADIDKEIYADGIISTAPESGAYYQVNAGLGMSLSVNAGKCYIRGRKAAMPTSTTLMVEPASSANRTDRVVLRLDLNHEVRDVVIDIKKGDDTLTRTSSIWELGLADVLVRKGEVEISQADITDLRFDSSICGRAYNELLEVDTTGIFNQMAAIMDNEQNNWQSQTDTQQAQWKDMTEAQKNDYSAWKNQIDSWRDLTAVELSKVVTVDFDNLSAYPGTSYKCVFSPDGGIVESLAYNSGGTLAEKLTAFEEGGGIVATLTVYNTDGTIFRKAITTTVFNNDGSILTLVDNG